MLSGEAASGDFPCEAAARTYQHEGGTDGPCPIQLGAADGFHHELWGLCRLLKRRYSFDGTEDQSMILLPTNLPQPLSQGHG